MHRSKKAGVGLIVGSVCLSFALAACGPGKDKEEAAAGSNVAQGEPVTFGVMTPTAGSAAIKEAEYGRLAAEWYVNNELGGINGRVLKFNVCNDDLSPENAVACANAWVADDVPVVVDGFSNGIGGAVPALLEAKIPYVGMVAGDPTVEGNENPAAYYFTGPLSMTAAGVIPMMQNVQAKDAAFVVQDYPAAHTFVEGTLVPMAKRAGIGINTTWVDATLTDFNTVAATIIEADPDLVGNFSLSEDACSSLFSSLRTLGYDKPIYAASCHHFVDDLPSEQSAGTLMNPRSWLPQAYDHAPAEVQKQLKGYENAMAAVGHEGETSGRAVYTFTSIVTLAEILNAAEVSDFTAENVAKVLSEVKDQQAFMGPPITCDGEQVAGVPSACSSYGIVFTVQEDGSYRPSSPDGFEPIDLEKLLG